MDEAIIYTKIESLERCLNRISAKTPNSVDLLIGDVDRQDIIVLNLERAVQICVDIAAVIVADLHVRTPTSMAESFTLLTQEAVLTAETAEKLRKSVGFRNIAVHEYSEIDWEIVYAIATKCLDDFKSFAREITQWASVFGQKTL